MGFNIGASVLRDPKNVVFIVSGKDKKTLTEWFTSCGKLGLVADHGYFFSGNAYDKMLLAKLESVYTGSGGPGTSMLVLSMEQGLPLLIIVSIRVQKFVLCGAQLSCSCILATCMVLLQAMNWVYMHMVLPRLKNLWRLVILDRVLEEDVIKSEFDEIQEHRAIQEHRECQSRSGPDEHEDLVDVLLRIQTDPNQEIGLTDDQIKAVLTDMFVAGTDTSAATLVWTMLQLIKNPSVMRLPFLVPVTEVFIDSLKMLLVDLFCMEFL
ncbi:hypothetical protein POM88_012328 [Heracleum sosnowskyi]|uniref:Cytochrome P450 n=1 Tax=Heracleum sosnowskyi TaxID=360622 RepID=A0AAD8N2D3_9APIA|nr:hypothetical protein POM88_012328 [Heracleum sosnowskyi]